MPAPSIKDSSFAPPLPPSSWLPRLLVSITALAALILVVLQVGFVGEVTPWLHRGTLLLSLLFAIEQSLTWLSRRHLSAWAKREAILLGTALFMLIIMLCLALAGWMGGHDTKLSLLAHSAVQGVVLAILVLRGLRHQARLTAITLRPGWLLLTGFALIVLAGTALLKMPRAVVPGAELTWLDALFTSTSAVCVTGLTVVNTATFFTPTGQIIILALIQIGGLGIMTLTFFTAAILFQGLSLHDRLLLGEMIAEKRLAHVGETLRFIVIFTIIAEALGAVAIFFTLPGDHDAGERMFHAVFHSVSAFCNAGFSTFPNNLADEAVRQIGSLHFIVCALIIMGGLGTLPAYDGLRFLKRRLAWMMDPTLARPRLRVHTRLVLYTTLILVVGGTLAIYASEFLLYHGASSAGRWMTAYFHSVTARTAGFNTVDMGGIGPVTIHLLVFLMLVGGSPGGTAGGIRTTVFAVATLHLWNQLRGLDHIALFKRRLPSGTGARALGILVLVMAWLFVNFAVLRQLQPGTPDTALVFELVSAFATVGLSLNLSPELTTGAKLVIVLNMFVGRLGLFTLATTFMPLARKPLHSHPQEDVLLV